MTNKTMMMIFPRSLVCLVAQRRGVEAGDGRGLWGRRGRRLAGWHRCPLLRPRSGQAWGARGPVQCPQDFGAASLPASPAPSWQGLRGPQGCRGMAEAQPQPVLELFS